MLSAFGRLYKGEGGEGGGCCPPSADSTSGGGGGCCPPSADSTSGGGEVTVIDRAHAQYRRVNMLI